MFIRAYDCPPARSLVPSQSSQHRPAAADRREFLSQRGEGEDLAF